MFTLNKNVSNTGAMAQADLVNVAMALRALGHYDHPDKNEEPLADADLFAALSRFQSQNGLAPTGQMARMDATHRALKAALRQDAQVGQAFLALRSDYDERCDVRDYGAVMEPVGEPAGVEMS